MKRRRVRPSRVLAPVLALLAFACGPAKPPSGASPGEAAALRGKRVYAANCTTCHNPDPSKPGSVGPAVKGSSRALLEARVLRAAYPPDYKPQRQTKAMPAMPHLAGSIDDLAAYLK